MTDRVLAVVGPTAAGKSDHALGLASRSTTTVEIVAADAFTLYRGMDVATAKPSVDERRRVPHHLVDVLAPSDESTVVGFQQRARGAIDAIHGRGHVPVLVGGSGLYFRAIVDDLRFPPTDESVRARLEAKYEDDPHRAHRDLAARDPRAAERIEPGNLRRSVRALEVVELTGEPFSSYAAAWDRYESIYPGLEVVGLDRPNADLRERIAARSRDMVARGLLEEAARLRTGGLSRTARQAIGYAEAFRVLDGTLPSSELAVAIERRTWRYARRQRAWFRRDPRITWHGAAPAQPDPGAPRYP